MIPRNVTYSDGKTGVIRYRKKMPGFDGRCSRQTRAINLKATLDHTQQAETLLHELAHQGMERWRVESPDDDLEEVVVNTLVGNLIDLWKLNPELFLWIHLGFTEKKSE